MIDAAGRLPPSGLLVGNLLALGSYWECVNSSEPTKSAKSGEATLAPIRGQFCTVSLVPVNASGANVLGALLQFKLGLCVPDACNATDLSQFVERVLEMAHALPVVGEFVDEVELVGSTCQVNEPELTGLAISGM